MLLWASALGETLLRAGLEEANLCLWNNHPHDSQAAKSVHFSHPRDSLELDSARSKGT